MFMKYIYLFISLSICFHFSFSQDSIQRSKLNSRDILSIGGKKWGLGIGNNPKSYSGIKFNIKNKSNLTNGINLYLFSSLNLKDTIKTNGIGFSLLFLEQSHINGIGISPLWLECNSLNGIGFGGLFGEIDYGNGIFISSLVSSSFDRFNGINISGLYQVSNITNGISISGLGSVHDIKINGLAFAPIFTKTQTCNGILTSLITISDTTKGAQIGLINYSKNIQGIQLGLINIIRQNPKWRKVLPFINFHIKKPQIGIDSLKTGNYIIVKHYENDNSTLKSTESFKLNNQILVKEGIFSIFNKELYEIEIKQYSNDTLTSSRVIKFYNHLDYKYYTRYIKKFPVSIPRLYDINYSIRLQHDTTKETIYINNSDTIEHYKHITNRLVYHKKKYSTDYSDILYLFYNEHLFYNSEIYKGRNIVIASKLFGVKELLYGDTLTSQNDFTQNVYLADESIDNEYYNIYKKNVGFHFNSSWKIEGLSIKKSDSLIVKKTYYDFSKNILRKISYYSNSIQIDSIYNHKGELIKSNIFFQTAIEQDSIHHFYDKNYSSFKVFYYKKNILRKVEFNDNYDDNIIRYNKNGLLKREEQTNMETYTIIRKYYKNGSLKKEKCNEEGQEDNLIYKYDKKGILKP